MMDEKMGAEDAAPKPVVRKKRAVKPKTIKMVRGNETADVHPDEVDNYRLGDWVEDNRLTMNRRVETFRTEMAAAETGYDVVASGAYFAYVRHPFGHETGRVVARRLLEEQHVLSLAGEMFGPGQEPYLRLAFANLDDELIPELVARLAACR